jgi:hypothetical protein
MIINVQAKSSDCIVTHLDEFTAMGLPPIPQDKPDATMVSTQMMMYFTALYVPPLLNPAGYTLHQTWELLYPAIVEANDLDWCRPLLNWLSDLHEHQGTH